jgi:hypothetical protein
LLDFHMTDAAFKAFRAHVSRYPGCDAKRVVLSHEEKQLKGDTSKSKSTVTHIAITAEGLRAFHSASEWPMSDDMKHAVRFWDDRVETRGHPTWCKRCGPGQSTLSNDFKLTPDFLKLERPHWRFGFSHKDEPVTGDPDSLM